MVCFYSWKQYEPSHLSLQQRLQREIQRLPSNWKICLRDIKSIKSHSEPFQLIRAGIRPFRSSLGIHSHSMLQSSISTEIVATGGVSAAGPQFRLSTSVHEAQQYTQPFGGIQQVSQIMRPSASQLETVVIFCGASCTSWQYSLIFVSLIFSCRCYDEVETRIMSRATRGFWGLQSKVLEIFRDNEFVRLLG